VVLYHFTFGQHTQGKLDGGGVLTKFFWPPLKPLFAWGHLGVEVFFVISGFVIPYSLWNIRYQVRGFFKYMLKRIVRICPPAYMAIILTIGVWLIIDKFIHHNNTYLATLSINRLVGNVLFLYPFDDTRWIIGVCWTLSVEFQFYIIIGLLFNFLFKQQNALWFVGLFVSMVALPFIPNFPPHTFFSYSPLFALGGAALLYKKKCISTKYFWLIIALFFGLSYLLMPLIASIFGLGTTLIIALVKVRHGFFSFFGKISFSLYLTHVLVGSIAEFILTKLLPEKTALQQCFGIFLLIILALTTACVYYLLVEKPILRVGKKIH